MQIPRWFLSSLVLAGSSAELHATDCGFITFALALCLLEWLCFNGLNRPESLDKQEFSRGVAGSGQRRGGVEMAGFCGDSRSICQQFEGIVYLGLKQRLHDRWRGENLPSPWRRTQASTRKLLSADSFILVDIYQVNYPCSFQLFTTTSTAFLTYMCVHACVCVRLRLCASERAVEVCLCGSSAVSFGDSSQKYTSLNYFSKRLI